MNNRPLFFTSQYGNYSEGIKLEYMTWPEVIKPFYAQSQLSIKFDMLLSIKTAANSFFTGSGKARMLFFQYINVCYKLLAFYHI